MTEMHETGPFSHRSQRIEKENTSERTSVSEHEINRKSFRVTTNQNGLEDDRAPVEFSSEVEVVIAEEPLISNFQAGMHIFKTAVGSGVLAMPFIVRSSGLLVGTAGIASVSILVIHACNILAHTTQYIRRHQNIGDSEILDYGKVLRQSIRLGPSWFTKYTWLTYILQLSILTGQFGFLSVCTIFVAENLKDLVDYNWPNKVAMGVELYKLIVYFIMLGIVMVKSLDRMTLFSTAANIMGVGSLGIALTYCVTHLQSSADLPLATTVGSVPVMASMVLYAFEVITVVVPLENKMKDKAALPGLNGVLSTTLLIATILYTALGFYGYMCFGDDVKDTIIYSMPMEPWYWMITKPLYVVAVLFSYAIQFYVLMQITWKVVLPRLSGRSRLVILLTETGLRVALVSSAFLLALLIPRIGLLISLIGASACFLMTFFFPPLAHSLVVWHSCHGNPTNWTKAVLIKNSLIGIMSLFGVGIGTYLSVSDLIKAYTNV
jgi:solute carrier family 36 (proton-coupled amino acid transporter)